MKTFMMKILKTFVLAISLFIIYVMLLASVIEKTVNDLVSEFLG